MKAEKQLVAVVNIKMFVGKLFGRTGKKLTSGILGTEFKPANEC